MYSQIIKDKDLSTAQFKLFQNLIYEKSGIHLDDGKLDSLRISLLSRIAKNKFNDYFEYYDFIKSYPIGDNEFRELLNLITVNETSFFRNPSQFKALQDVVIPEIINKKKDKEKNINIWAAGCSTGEEPYTIAIILLSTILDINNWNIHILGTDVSARVLEIAKKGIYPKWSIRLVDDYSRMVYFDKIDEEHYALKENIKKLVELKFFNLIETPYPLNEMKNWDIIFCRNVTIYFKYESTERVIHNFYNSLGEGGYLFLGHAENLNQNKEAFTLVEHKGAFFYRKGKPEKLDIKVKRVSTWCKEDDRAGVVQLPERRKAVDISNQKFFEDRRKNNQNEKIQSLEETNKDKVQPCIRAEAELLLKKSEEILSEGKIDESLQLCLKAKEMDPVFFEPYLLLGIIYKDDGNMSESIIQFERVIYINPQCFLAHFYLGDIYYQIGELKKSVESYNNAIKFGTPNENKQGQSRFDEGIDRQALVEVCKKNISKINKGFDF